VRGQSSQAKGWGVVIRPGETLHWKGYSFCQLTEYRAFSLRGILMVKSQTLNANIWCLDYLHIYFSNISCFYCFCFYIQSSEYSFVHYLIDIQLFNRGYYALISCINFSLWYFRLIGHLLEFYFFQIRFCFCKLRASRVCQVGYHWSELLKGKKAEEWKVLVKNCITSRAPLGRKV